ncbi:hypothetical protein BN1708_004471, partial [Verticillium longisporum]
MPPRRRKRPSGANVTATVSTPPTSDPNEELHDPPPPLFNTSFSTHRTSPLYIGNEPLSPSRLNDLALRLRDTLVGDVVRGVQVGLEGSDTSLGRAGSLERVVMRWFEAGALLRHEPDDTHRPASRDLSSDAIFGRAGGGAGSTGTRGLCIEMRYENALCTAIMLPQLEGQGRASDDAFHGRNGAAMSGWLGIDKDTEAEKGRFVHLPLLLLRMPTPMKAFVTDFLARTFDCRISPLRLGTKTLVASWERWIEQAGLPTQGPLAKDLVLTLGFFTAPPTEPVAVLEGSAPAVESLGIKSVDIIIPPSELGRFVQVGESRGVGSKRKRASQSWENDSRKRSKLAGGSTEEGWAWRDGEGREAGVVRQPFIEATAEYFDKHLAIDLFHPSVRITKIACGGFALSENRIKVFATGSGEDDSSTLTASRAVWTLVSDLVDRAA